MTLVAYNGHETRIFMDYRDLGTEKTLTAEPGGTYDMAPASGRLVPDVPEQWFTVLEQKPEASGALAEGGSAPPEPGSEEGGDPHDLDPETGEPQQF